MKEIVALDEYISDESYETVAISGCFDLLHIGHITFFEEAAKKGDQFIILLESDEFIRKHKHREPFHTQMERAQILSHIDIIDQIITLPYMSSHGEYDQMWAKVKPGVIALTDGDPYIEQKQQQAEKYGGEAKIVTPIIEGKSSTQALEFDPNKNDLT